MCLFSPINLFLNFKKFTLNLLVYDFCASLLMDVVILVKIIIKIYGQPFRARERKKIQIVKMVKIKSEK